MPQGEWVPARCRTVAGLERLRTGPVNCIVVDWPGADAALIRRAREAGFAVIGDAGKDGTAAASARAAGLDAVIAPPGAAGEGVIPAAAVGKLSRAGPSPYVVVRECVWPGIRAGKKGEADSGPTGAPWIDANGWITRLARALAPGKTVWLDFAPPANSVVAADAWMLAAAEAAAYGARWILPAEAADAPAWNAVLRTLAFFDAHRDWPVEAVSSLAVISEFTGPDEFLSHEFLNLGARRQLPARILERSRAAALPWDGLSTFVYADSAAPDPALLRRLLEALNAGALLVAPPGLAPSLRGADAGESPCPGYRMLAIGKGRAAVAAAAWEDPYLMVADVRNLMGRRNAPVRLWNATSIVPLAAGPGNRTAVVHLVKYTSRPGDPVTLGLPDRYRAAQFHTPGAKPVRLEPHAARRGVEFHLPPFSVYGALVLEG